MFGLTARFSSMIFGGLSAILLAVCVYQHVQINGFLWVKGLEDKLESCDRDRNELRAELKAISDAKNEQKKITKGNIDEAEKGEQDARPIVKIIREAPIPPNCQTPGLEILRNEI